MAVQHAERWMSAGLKPRDPAWCTLVLCDAAAHAATGSSAGVLTALEQRQREPGRGVVRAVLKKQHWRRASLTTRLWLLLLLWFDCV